MVSSDFQSEAAIDGDSEKCYLPCLNVTCHRTATIPRLPAMLALGSLSHLRISTGFYAVIYM